MKNVSLKLNEERSSGKQNSWINPLTLMHCRTKPSKKNRSFVQTSYL